MGNTPWHSTKSIWHGRRTLLPAMLAVCGLAVLTSPAFGAPDEAALPKHEKAARKVAEAQRLVADAIPEERDDTENLLIEALRLDPHSADAYAELARYRLWETTSGLRPPSDLLEALELAEQAKALAPHRPVGDFLRCEILYTLGRSQEADRSCALAEQAFPDHVDTEVFRVRFKAESAPREAAEAAQRALAQGASPDLISGSLSVALLRLAKERSPGDVLAAFAKVHPDRWLWHRAGIAYSGEKRFQDARKAFEKAIALGNSLESRLQLGVLAQGQLKNPRLAIQEYRKLLETLEEKRQRRPDIVAGIQARLALAHLENNESAEAVRMAGAAMRTDVENERLIQAIHESFSRKKLAGELRSAFEYVATENPFLVFAHMTLGDMAMPQKRFSEAVAAYTKAMALTPEDDAAYAARGHAYYGLKDYELALRDFDAAIRNRPQESTHHYNRACMLARLGKEREALASLRTAILMDRSLARVAATDGDLLGMRQNSSIKSQLAALGVFEKDEGEDTATAAAEEPSAQ